MFYTASLVSRGRKPCERTIDTYSQSLLAHHSVNKKNTARTIEATLLALVLKPHAIRHAPMKDEPRYPAGRVIQDMPPDMEVAPPSLAKGRGR